MTFFIVITLPVANDAGLSVDRICLTTSSRFLPVPANTSSHTARLAAAQPKPFTKAQFGLTMK